MREYRLSYNMPAHGGYNSHREYFSCANRFPEHGDEYPYKDYPDDDGARYAAYARLETVKAKWPDLNTYPYGEPKIFARDIGEWEDIT